MCASLAPVTGELKLRNLYPFFGIKFGILFNTLIKIIRICHKLKTVHVLFQVMRCNLALTAKCLSTKCAITV